MSVMFSWMGPFKVGQDEILECVEARLYMRLCFDVEPSRFLEYASLYNAYIVHE